MKLDTKALRYLTTEDWRVLTAVETGSRNHEVVPTPLIVQLSGLRSASSGVQRSISTLAKANLIAKVKNAKYDGYRLTYGGLDYLALHTQQKQSTVYSVGNQIGVGKESDIFVVADSTGKQHVLKIHRLGRISFRTVKNNRDYGRRRDKKAATAAGSYWMYMSKLAALKEFTFMKKLWEEGVPVPEPRSQNRHTIVMEMIDGFPLRQIRSVPTPMIKKLYAELLGLIVRLAGLGLIHGDFNEFNIMIQEIEVDNKTGESNSSATTEQAAAESTTTTSTDDKPTEVSKGQSEQQDSSLESSAVKLVPTIIDFPQMVSIDHPDAETYFYRDIACVKRFFERRFRFVADDQGPTFEDAKNALKKSDKRLDIEAEASGFSKKMAKELEGYMREVGADGTGLEAGDEEGEADEQRDDEDEDGEQEDEDDADFDNEQQEEAEAEDEVDVQQIHNLAISDKRPGPLASLKQAEKARKSASGWVI